MKTIIQFIHELGDGGASTLVKEYALHLKKDGYRVVCLMVFPDWSSINLKTILENHIEVRFVFPDKSFLNRLKNKFNAPYFVSKNIEKLVDEYHPVALHAHLGVIHLLKPASQKLLWGRLSENIM